MAPPRSAETAVYHSSCVETTLAEMLDWLNRWIGPSRITATAR
jgi:hypothetical protein